MHFELDVALGPVLGLAPARHEEFLAEVRLAQLFGGGRQTNGFDVVCEAKVSNSHS